MGWAQSQSLLRLGSVAHPAAKTAIEIRIAAVLNVMPDLPRLPDGLVTHCLPLRLPRRLSGCPAPEPGNAEGGDNACRQRGPARHAGPGGAEQ